MESGVRLDLVREMRRLLDLAGTDEQAAIAQFHQLVDRHGSIDVGAAVAAVAPDEGGTLLG